MPSRSDWRSERLIGNPQLSLFASFGGVAMLLFADFPGGQSARLGAYLALFVMGAVLIVLGTLASTIAWLAVLGMAVVGFGVLFSGVLSAASAARDQSPTAHLHPAGHGPRDAWPTYRPGSAAGASRPSWRSRPPS